MTKTSGLEASLLRVVVLVIFGSSAFCQDNSPTMTYRQPLAFGVSAPLRDLPQLPLRDHFAFREEPPVRQPDFHPGRILGPVRDPVEQRGAGGLRIFRLA